MFSKRQAEEEQGEFWIERSRVSKPKSQGFYRSLNEHFGSDGFCAAGVVVARASVLRGEPGRTTGD